ncbi:hypothetical protein [Romboutsia lituseburensis]|uniref:Carboxypeptidase regulatory-like domain-containing protein n=1 Tax=Romboutsia lituseburensis DSM 797 TaxID=1121325 RepID=A0A1G9KII0_9FIRM|nr:hypothetical protein [Romboutsia lituseburensis]CEH34923.1 Intradiol ring-cleavage dioxygenase, core [Romboutsia lituseburensis]SDL49531.1 hypothetical protein SAMN04515677_102160 [Romboutsia lituseburensis DSM 797]
MSEPKKIIVSGKKIIEEQILDISTTLANNKYFFLTGIVYQPNGIPLEGAAIVVYEIYNDGDTENKNLVGITFTVEGGVYGISLLIDKKYCLVTYS